MSKSKEPSQEAMDIMRMNTDGMYGGLFQAHAIDNHAKKECEKYIAVLRIIQENTDDVYIDHAIEAILDVK